MLLQGRFVVFDLDQTLIRSAGMEEAFEYAADHVGADPARSAAVWQVSRGRPLYEQAAEITGDPSTVVPFVDAFWECFGAGDPTPLPGAGEVLERLRSMGATLYLSTGSHPKVALPWLAGLGWAELFALPLGSSADHQKGRAHYASFFEHAGLPAHEFAARAATVGDGQYDMAYGVEHDVPVRVGYAPDDAPTEQEVELIAAGATHIIRQLMELPDLLVRAWARP